MMTETVPSKISLMTVRLPYKRLEERSNRACLTLQRSTQQSKGAAPGAEGPVLARITFYGMSTRQGCSLPRHMNGKVCSVLLKSRGIWGILVGPLPPLQQFSSGHRIQLALGKSLRQVSKPSKPSSVGIGARARREICKPETMSCLAILQLFQVTCS